VPTVRYNSGADRSAGNERRPERDVGTLADRQHLVEHDFAADFSSELLHLELIAARDTVLFPAGFDDRKHFDSENVFFEKPRSIALRADRLNRRFGPGLE
jgi:hypothetical protein